MILYITNNVSILFLEAKNVGSLQRYINKHCTESNVSHSNGDYNFQIICHIINYITLLGVEFTNAHIDTSFA